MTVRGLMRCKNRYKTAEAAEAALQELVDAGLGRWVVPASNGKAGRPVDHCFELTAQESAYETMADAAENGGSVNVNDERQGGEDVVE